MTVVSKALLKAGRFFDTNGLEGCSKIASCVKEQVNNAMCKHIRVAQACPKDLPRTMYDAHQRVSGAAFYVHDNRSMLPSLVFREVNNS